VSTRSPIAKRWHALATSIDGRNQRERVLLFLVTIAVAYFICYFSLFKPLFAQEAKIQQKLALNRSNLVALQLQTQEMLAKAQQDPDLPNRKRLEELTNQLNDIDAPMAELMRSLVRPKEMTAMVKAVLSGLRNVRVVSLENLPPEAVSPQNAAHDDKPVVASTPLYKHGLRIAVKGGFYDILGFFRDLEKLSWKVLWDQADIKTERYPESTAVVTVYTLSTDESWISL
jgi:MSHA biogenesis protein MshJ